MTGIGAPSAAFGAGSDADGPRGRRRDGESARKTVTFGDSSVVRSNPLWALVALLLIVGLWFVATYAWGFPDGFRVAYEAGARESGERITDANMIRACDLDEAACGRDAYTQYLTPRQFPSVRDTWNGFFNLIDNGYRTVSLWDHTWASLWRVIRGMFWGVAIGVPIGLAMGLSSRARGFFDTPVELFRPIPPLALMPLFVLWFGIGDPSAVRLLIFASIWIMIIAARSGAQAANLSKVRAAYSLGANRRQVLTRVILPNALPSSSPVSGSRSVCRGGRSSRPRSSGAAPVSAR